ncbi:28S ribosomal protein S21, mitochondrial [Anthophora retusa]
MGMQKHAQFLARTVMVRDNNIGKASRLLNAILSREGIYGQYRYTRCYEKPTQTRRRINYERCKAIYSEDMSRKIGFILRKNRTDPYPGAS